VTASRSPTAAVLVIGNEILSGRTRDANLAHLGERLAALGVRLREARVVEDVEADIVAAVDALRKCHDFVFTTGGIGPTHDDITTVAVARAFGVAVERSAEAEARLTAYYGAANLNPARLRMADVPSGAELIDNPVSAAPGYRIENVYVFAGVPRIMQGMFDAVAHRFSGAAPIVARSVSGHLRESLLAEGLARIQARYPELALGSYPFARDDRVGTSIVARGTDRRAVDAAIAEVDQLFVSLGVTPFARDESVGTVADGGRQG
jgi:molybdopterin-biosynthesis enzyme MoeA-like protein